MKITRTINGKARKWLRKVYKLFPQPYGYAFRYWLMKSLKLNRDFDYFSFNDYKRLLVDLRDVVNTRQFICYLPNQTWFSSLFQRPQQMARAFSAKGELVIYFEPWYKLQNLIPDNQKGLREFKGIKQLEKNLYLIRFPEDMFTHIFSKFPPRCFIMLWPWQEVFIPLFTKSKVIYEIVDDHSLIENFENDWGKPHVRWLKKADVVTVTADDLFEKAKINRSDVVLIPNAVLYDDWQESKSNNIPDDMVVARKSEVVIGYYGAIAKWFDWDLWSYAAKTKPEWSFVMIGYLYDISPEMIQQKISLHKNMFFLGPKPYQDLKYYLANFDVATIPFILNEITHACSPVKLFEYFAGGKPVVATRMREILKYKSVLTAVDAVDFVSQLEIALQCGKSPDYLRLIKEEAKNNTWQSRVEQVLTLLNR